MKKWVLIIGLIILLHSVSAVSLGINNEYAARETIIGMLSQDVVGTVQKSQVSLVRDGHIPVAFEYDVKKLGSDQYIWLVAPQTAGSYTLRFNDLIATVGGAPQVVDYEKSFIVSANSTDYSISPGAVYANSDFEIVVTLYESFNKKINVDFPSSREVTLFPGTNEIDFDLDGFVGTEFLMINVGKYVVPSYLIGADSYCGDGQIDGDEVCDGVNLGGKTCSDAGNYTSGELKCASSCMAFNTSMCLNSSQVCGSANLGACSDDNACEDAGGYWYNDYCYSIPEDENLCGNEEIDSGEVCDGDDLDGKTCRAIGFSGGTLRCSKTCASFNVSGCYIDENEVRPTEVKFRFDPFTIRSTALRSERAPIYSFRIKNEGIRIEELFLDYDKNIFIVYPDSGIILEENETVDFNVTLRSTEGSRVRSVVGAYVGNEYQYLLFDVNFTDDPNEAETEYDFGDDSGGFYCSERGGSFCSSSQVCSTSVVKTIDSSVCCLSTCVDSSSGGSGRSWIGYLVSGIALLILIIIFLKYRKTNSSVNPLNSTLSKIERTRP